jgi:hypothetical protein
MSAKTVVIRMPKPATADEWVGGAGAVTPPPRPEIGDIPQEGGSESQIVSLERRTRNGVARKLLGTLFLGSIASGVIILLITLDEGVLNLSSLKSVFENLKNPLAGWERGQWGTENRRRTEDRRRINGNRRA